MILIRAFLFVLFLLLASTGNCIATTVSAKIHLDVKEFRLQNGMLFLIVERHAAPQVACRIAIRAGSALEQAGKTGIAHMLEHMMFKGTMNFGTLDPKKDKELQDKIEAAYQVVLAEQRKRNPDQNVIGEKLAEMENLRIEVQKIYVPQAFSSQLGRNGAVGVNAFTSRDQTQYLMSVPSDMMEQWASIVSEQLFEPSWREFYVEKEVVQREWAFRYVNSPNGAAWLDLHATAYSAHPYRNPVIGWKADMEKYSTRDAVEFHKRYYSPTNAVCVLVGDITLERARRLAKIYFERYPAGEPAPEEVTREPLQEGQRRSIRYLKGARTPLVRIGFHGATMGTGDFYALDALTMVLSHGRGARMTQDIVNKGLAVDAWAYNPDNRYGGMVILGGSPKELDQPRSESLREEERRDAYVKACERLEELLLQEVEKLKTDPVEARELERIKKLNERDFLDRMRSNEELAGTLATTEVEVGWRYLTTYLEKMSRVGPEDIRRVARKYLRTENKTSVYLIPGGEPDREPEPYAEVRSLSGTAASRLAKPASLENHSGYPTPEGWKHPLSFEREPKKIEYPKAETQEVEGGMVFFLPDRQLPLIDLTLLVKAGAVDLDETRIGLTDVLNETLIRGGTEEHPPSELAMVLDENAIRLSVSAGEEETVIRLSVLKEDWEKGISLLRSVLTKPRFDQNVLEAVKQQLLTALKRQGGEAQIVARREAMIWHFNGHPYGRDPLIGLDTLPGITRNDLMDFMDKYFVPSNMVAAVAGDIEKPGVVDGLSKLFQALPKRPAPRRNLAEPSLTPPVLALIPKPGQVQSQVVMLLPGIKRTHPDYWKLGLLMDIFGGSDSLLSIRLRDDLGLIYAGWFYQAYKWHAGMLVGYLGCKGDQTAEAIGETVKIMAGLQNQVPIKELSQKRLDALNSFVFNVDTPSQLVEVYGRYYMRKEPLDTLAQIQDAYMSATEEELENLARNFLIPEMLQIFVVGDKTIRKKAEDATQITLGEDLEALSKGLGLAYREMTLR